MHPVVRLFVLAIVYCGYWAGAVFILGIAAGLTWGLGFEGFTIGMALFAN